MKRTTRCGLTVTYAPFWLVWLPPDDGGPERFPHLMTTQPVSGKGEPLTNNEALEYWLDSKANYCTATNEAEVFLTILRDCK